MACFHSWTKTSVYNINCGAIKANDENTQFVMSWLIYNSKVTEYHDTTIKDIYLPQFQDKVGTCRQASVQEGIVSVPWTSSDDT